MCPGRGPECFLFGVSLLLLLMKFDMVAEMALSTTRESQAVKVRSR